MFADKLQHFKLNSILFKAEYSVVVDYLRPCHKEGIYVDQGFYSTVKCFPVKLACLEHIMLQLNMVKIACLSMFYFINSCKLIHAVKFCISSHIILMLADDMACNPRNPRPGKERT